MQPFIFSLHSGINEHVVLRFMDLRSGGYN